MSEISQAEWDFGQAILNQPMAIIELPSGRLMGQVTLGTLTTQMRLDRHKALKWREELRNEYKSISHITLVKRWCKDYLTLPLSERALIYELAQKADSDRLRDSANDGAAVSPVLAP